MRPRDQPEDDTARDETRERPRQWARSPASWNSTARTAAIKPVEERVKHYKEFVVPLADKDVKVQAARCMDCGIPYCHSGMPGTTHGCPVNNQIPDWNDLVYRGHWQEALRNLHSTNNFPEFTGRVCPAPCEASCTLNLDDKPVAIKTIECAIVDKGFAEGWVKPEVARAQDRQEDCHRRLWPSGFAAAQQLCRAGHEVHVYEKNASAGGLLRYGIPDFKLEKTGRRAPHRADAMPRA